MEGEPLSENQQRHSEEAPFGHRLSSSMDIERPHQSPPQNTSSFSSMEEMRADVLNYSVDELIHHMQRSEDASVVTSPSAAGLQGGAAAGAAPSSLRRARQSAPGGNGSKLKLPGSLDEIHEQDKETPLLNGGHQRARSSVPDIFDVSLTKSASAKKVSRPNKMLTSKSWASPGRHITSHRNSTNAGANKRASQIKSQPKLVATTPNRNAERRGSHASVAASLHLSDSALHTGVQPSPSASEITAVEEDDGTPKPNPKGGAAKAKSTSRLSIGGGGWDMGTSLSRHRAVAPAPADFARDADDGLGGKVVLPTLKSIRDDPDQEEGERRNDAGHILIMPEKHMHIHPAMQPKQIKSRFMFMVGMCSFLPILMPSNRWVERWDFLMSFLLVYIAVVAPVDTAFMRPKLDEMFFCNRLLDAFFLFDFILQFNLAAPNKFGRMLKDRGEIADKYLREWFLLDLISLIPFDVMVLLESVSKEAKGFRLVRLMRLMKMLRLLRANRMFSRFESRFAVNYSMLQLYSYLALLCLLCHWLACGWYMLLEVEENKECVYQEDLRTGSRAGPEDARRVLRCCYNWLDCYSYTYFQTERTMARKYFLSLVWSTGEVLTVGSDIYPVTDYERAYQLISRIISGVVYAYLLGAVCSIFTAMSRDQSKYYEDMDHLNKFLREKHLTVIDPNLCGSLRLFYRFAHQAQGSAQHMHEVLNCISPTLRGKIAWRVHSRWLMKMPLFKGSRISLPFYTALALKLQSRLFAPLEPVIEAHHEADTMFVMEKGMLITKGPGSVKTAGDFFGEDAIATWRVNQLRGYTATAFTHGTCYQLEVTELFQIMNRPQYLHECRPVFVKVFRARCCNLVSFFYQTLYHACNDSSSFQEACDFVCEDLSFVDSNAMEPILVILGRLYKQRMDVAFDHVFAVQYYLDLRENLLGQTGDDAEQFEIESERLLDVNPVNPALDSMRGRPDNSPARGLLDTFTGNPTPYRPKSANAANKRALENAIKNQTAGVARILKVVGMQEMAASLVEKEDLDADTMKKMGALEFHSIGIPMRKAIKLAAHLEEQFQPEDSHVIEIDNTSNAQLNGNFSNVFLENEMRTNAPYGRGRYSNHQGNAYHPISERSSAATLLGGMGTRRTSIGARF